MTFACKNYDLNNDRCNKMKSECIPGRPGCVLEGKVKFGEEVQIRLDKLEKERAERMKQSSKK